VNYVCNGNGCYVDKCVTVQDIHLAKRFYDMAAETSADAKVPVMIALSRLNIYFFIEYLKDVSSLISRTCFGLTLSLLLYAYVKIISSM